MTVNSNKCKTAVHCCPVDNSSIPANATIVLHESHLTQSPWYPVTAILPVPLVLLLEDELKLKQQCLMSTFVPDSDSLTDSRINCLERSSLLSPGRRLSPTPSKLHPVGKFTSSWRPPSGCRVSRSTFCSSFLVNLLTDLVILLAHAAGSVVPTPEAASFAGCTVRQFVSGDVARWFV